MAIRVSRPGGGGRFSRISPAPGYGSVISRYTDQIKSALAEEEQAEIEKTILDYKAGTITWDTLKSFLERKIIEEDDGTLKKVKLQQSLVDLGKFEAERVKNLKRSQLEAKMADKGITPQERYDIEKQLLGLETPGTDQYVAQQQKVITSFDNAETQRVMQKREELLKKYEAGGITPDEELAIILELKSIANPDSQVYNQLITQEQNAREKLDTYQKGEGLKSLTNTSRDQLASLIDAEKQWDVQYQRGAVTGSDRDTARAKNAQEAFEVLQKMANAGISVPIELLTDAKTNLTTATTLLQFREQGQVFDVVDSQGVVRPMTFDGRDPFSGKTIEYQNYPIQLNPTTGIWEVFDPITGQPVMRTASNKKQAEAQAEKLGLVTFDALVADANGKPIRKTLSQDKETGAYYNAQNPSEVYIRIPQTAKDAGRYTLQNVSPKWRENEQERSAIKQQVQTFTTGGATTLDIGGLVGQVAAGQAQQAKPRSFFQNIGDFLGGTLQQNIQKEGQVLRDIGGTVAGAAGQAAGVVGKKILEQSPAYRASQGKSPYEIKEINPRKAVSDFVSGIGNIQLLNRGKPTGTVGQAVGDILGNVKANIGPAVRVFEGAAGQAARSFAPNVQAQTSPAPSFNFGNFSLPSFDFSKFSLPKVDTSAFKLPSFDLPKINMPSFDFLGGIKRLGAGIGSTVGGLFTKAKSAFGL